MAIKNPITTAELYFSYLNDNDRVTEIFSKAILYAFPDLNNLEVEYDGKNITFNFDGDLFVKNRVLALVNDLIAKTTEKKPEQTGIDFEKIMTTMRTSLYLKVDAQPGALISNAIKDAIRIADILCVTVEFEFNSVKCLINPHADAEIAEARWNDALMSKKERKIMSA